MGLSFLELVESRKYLGSVSGLRGQSFSGHTGTIAAGLAAGSTVFAARYPLAATGRFQVGWIHLHYVCLTSLTAAVSAGRRLGLRRGSGGGPSGGTAIDVVLDVAGGSETALTGQVATTTGLTMTGVAPESAYRARMMLSHVGTAGQDFDELWKLEGFSLAPGELFAVVAPQAFDAAGTWQLAVKGWGCEVPAL